MMHLGGPSLKERVARCGQAIDGLLHRQTMLPAPSTVRHVCRFSEPAGPTAQAVDDRRGLEIRRGLVAVRAQKTTSKRTLRTASPI